MAKTLAQKLLDSHQVESDQSSGDIALKFDQTLCQDATGTLVMLALEAMSLERAKTKVSVQYVDHNLIQDDYKNPDDHLFLLSAAKRFGLYYSRPGNGISHPLHMQHFAKPGDTLIGSDSHTCAAGALGMLAMGAGGADVAMAIAGEPVKIPRPKIWGIRLTGSLPPWVSAKDVILEMLRRHGVKGGVNRVIEYHGPGVMALSAMDRHVIANMGAELGATASVFPSDEETHRYLSAVNREHAWQALAADEGAQYDYTDEINLDELEPLIAKPSSPQNVVPVREVEGEPIYQAYIGSSANPGFRDFAVAASLLEGHTVPNNVSLDINPSTRHLLQQLSQTGYLESLIASGARLHQAGCNGCIGMGQAPASGRNSLRTTPRNFPGRSGTAEDSVWLCSPEVAAASALEGKIADPRRVAKSLGMDKPELKAEPVIISQHQYFVAPDEHAQNERPELVKGPNIQLLPELDKLPERLSLPIVLQLDDDVSTDEIMPAGADALPFRSNIPRIADFCFRKVDPEYPKKARTIGQHAILAGENYGQGSSREHAALAPRHLGLRVVLAKSFARIHKQNLVNYGILPLVYDGQLANSLEEYELDENAELVIDNLHDQLKSEQDFVKVSISDRKQSFRLKHGLTKEQVQMLLAGSITNWIKNAA